MLDYVEDVLHTSAMDIAYFVAIGVVLVVCTSISVVLSCLRQRRLDKNSKDEPTLENDQLEKKGCLWCWTRLFIDIPRAASIIAVATVPFDWGLDRATLGHPIIYVLVGAVDIVVFLECILFRCFSLHGPFFKKQAEVYLFYSLTMGFPFGTATKILWLLHAGGNAAIPASYIPVPYIIGISIATAVIIVRLLFACCCSDQNGCCKQWSRARITIAVLVAVAVWALTLLLLNHAGVYKIVKFHNINVEVWLICLLPVWSVAAVAYVYVTQRFWLLIFQICSSKSARAKVQYRSKLQLLYTTPDMCVVYGYLAVALVLVSQADGFAAADSCWFYLIIATESVSLVFTILPLCIPVCKYFTAKAESDDTHYTKMQSVAGGSIHQGTKASNTSSVPDSGIMQTEIQESNPTASDGTHELQCPSYWQLTGNLTSHQHDFQTTTVDHTTKQQIVHLMEKTWYEYEERDGIQLGLKVNDVQQVENARLLSQYLNYRSKLRLEHDLHKAEDKVSYISKLRVMTQHQRLEQKGETDPRINECYLWHAPSQQTVDEICSNGFDPRRSACGSFGSGVYFAEKSSKSNDYAACPTGGSNYMFLTRVCLGNFCKVVEHCTIERPPCVVPECREGACRHILHDSVLGDKQGSVAREFILYKLHSCYPDYLIAYHTYPC